MDGVGVKVGPQMFIYSPTIKWFRHFSHYPLIMVVEVSFFIQRERFGFKGFNRIKISIHSKPDRLR